MEVARPAPAPNVLLSKLVKSAKKLDFWEEPLLDAPTPLDCASTVPEPTRKGLIEVSKVFVSMILQYYANCPSAAQDHLGEQRAKNPLIQGNA